MKTLRAPVGFSAISGPPVATVVRLVRAGGSDGSATYRRHFPSRLSRVLLRTTAGALLVSAFAAIEARGQDVPPAPVSVYHAPTDPAELLKVDEPMRRYFRERVPSRVHGGAQLRQLVDAILVPDGLHFAYDVEATFDARETFRQRRGNCLSFAFLIVAVTRDFGYTASFQNATDAFHWDRYGDLVASVHHINVRVETSGESYLVDLRPDLVPGTGFAGMQVIDDERAFAHFYAAVGFFKLLHAQSAEALQFMILATQTDPDCADAWANLGALHSHLGNLPEARACFERSLREDSRGVVAMDGFVSVLQRLGSPEDLQIAAKYERRAQAIRDRNPYYQQCLAARAQERGDWFAAEKLLRRAIALKDDEPRFYEQWVKVLLQLGRDDAARRAATKLEKLRHRLDAVPVHPVP